MYHAYLEKALKIQRFDISRHEVKEAAELMDDSE
jgi:hypothetical protein